LKLQLELAFKTIKRWGTVFFPRRCHHGNSPGISQKTPAHLPLTPLLAERLAALFDAEWYLSKYPDVAAAGVDALQHYLEHGVGEKRNPHPLFDTEWFLSRHPEVVSRGLNPLQHYIDLYGTDPGVQARVMAGRVLNLYSDSSSWPAVINPTEEAGIVISACSRLFEPLYANLCNIRQQGCDLPVDVWHLPGEFTARQIASLGSMANFVDAGLTPFNGKSGRHEVHGFKAWMLSNSRFRKTLMLDVNSFPLQNLKAIFQSGHRCILWRDGPWGTHPERITELRRSLKLSTHPFEFESGQLYVDKETEGVRHALRFAAAINTLGRDLYVFLYGDKETYSLAFDLLGESFSVAPAPEIYPVNPVRCANGGLIQPWFDGSILFYHPLTDRDDWWRFKAEWAVLKQEAAEAEKQCMQGPPVFD